MPATIRILLVTLLCLTGCHKSGVKNSKPMREEASDFSGLLREQLTKYGEVGGGEKGGSKSDAVQTKSFEFSMKAKDFSAGQFHTVMAAAIQQWGGMDRFAPHSGYSRTENGQPRPMVHESFFCGSDGKYLIVNADAMQTDDKTWIAVSIHAIDSE